MRIVICDDEKTLRKDLRRLIEVQMDLSGQDCIIEEFEDGARLLESEPAQEADILFLDIEMPRLSGMETARALRQAGCRALIIFVTAYPDFVFQGYEVSAFHYILKPYQEKKIREVLTKALEECRQKEPRYFVIDHKGGVLRLLLSDILYFKSEGRSVRAVTKPRQESFYGRLVRWSRSLVAVFRECITAILSISVMSAKLRRRAVSAAVRSSLSAGRISSLWR